ncbi:MAG TPA: DUF4124 domain-containing protein, partial [Candidatus Methylomirabilis sp.]|nr:DUF4124 domain-containing protein [Candidatus Methylomirabilis sp.]
MFLRPRAARHRPARPALAALALLLCFVSPADAQLYRWTDDNGETHFGQGPASVPERYRSRASIVGNVDPPRAP